MNALMYACKYNDVSAICSLIENKTRPFTDFDAKNNVRYTLSNYYYIIYNLLYIIYLFTGRENCL